MGFPIKSLTWLFNVLIGACDTCSEVLTRWTPNPGPSLTFLLILFLTASVKVPT